MYGPHNHQITAWTGCILLAEEGGTICGLMLVMGAFACIEGWGVGWVMGLGSGGSGCVRMEVCRGCALLQVVDMI